MKRKNPKANRDFFLWRKFKKGDRQSFGEIYREYYPALLNYGLKLKNDREFIKDCIQEMFLDITRYSKNLGDTDNIMFYLVTSLRHKIVRKIRYDELCRLDQTSYNSYLSDQGPEAKVVNMDQFARNKRVMRDLINKLPTREKEAMLMKFYLYLEYDDIAEIMGLNKQSVRNLIYRGIKHLREKNQQCRTQPLRLYS